jgi:hypothetical protein
MQVGASMDVRAPSPKPEAFVLVNVPVPPGLPANADSRDRVAVHGARERERIPRWGPLG